MPGGWYSVLYVAPTANLVDAALSQGLILAPELKIWQREWACKSWITGRSKPCLGMGH